MRTYLTNINIVGAVSCFQEREQCHWSIDWLVNNCDKVVIMLDNYDPETENIILEYKSKYQDKIEIIYSQEPVRKERNLIDGQIKKRWKIRQPYIREQLVEKLRKIHKEKPIDLLIWPDSDETFINEFQKYLEEFWNNRPERYMMCGFVEVFENFETIVYQKLSPHGRVWKFIPEMSCLPYTTRTINNPYKNEKGWKVRNLVVHMCHYNEEYRRRRQHFDNTPWLQESLDYPVWLLPKNVKNMSISEIAEYQPGAHGAPSKYPPTTLREYIKINNLNITI